MPRRWTSSASSRASTTTPSGAGAPSSGSGPSGEARRDPVHDVVDLRSDTLTLPTLEMREAMARAEVGDDVWEEDPTAKRLEPLAAERPGEAAGHLVALGTV